MSETIRYRTKYGDTARVEWREDVAVLVLRPGSQEQAKLTLPHETVEDMVATGWLRSKEAAS